MDLNPLKTKIIERLRRRPKRTFGKERGLYSNRIRSVALKLLHDSRETVEKSRFISEQHAFSVAGSHVFWDRNDFRVLDTKPTTRCYDSVTYIREGEGERTCEIDPRTSMF